MSEELELTCTAKRNNHQDADNNLEHVKSVNKIAIIHEMVNLKKSYAHQLDSDKNIHISVIIVSVIAYRCC